ncbi:polysaccharide deacetylase family protein [Haloimpatiens massiliensis]|uniref:polysaccharide deacetylase family protein n=1 Tax=Haloimpatiens massiliensis TaxID=1658110 RepID=UPI000C852EE7|nr:polysaccharide deacetylase family protein [Haloimpatiens massiliensis]
MIYIAIENKKYLKKIKYVFDTIFFNLGLDYKLLSQEKYTNINEKDILIVYGFTKEYENDVIGKFFFNNLIIIKDSMKLFHEDFYMKESSLGNVQVKNFEGFLGKSLISIFSNDNKLFVEETYKCDKKMFLTNFDFISDIFFMLTRYEEVVNTEKIEEIYNRFPAVQSVAIKNNFLHRPIVNEDIEFIWYILHNFNLKLERKKWWKNNEFAVCLTHDVDMLFKYDKLKNEIRNCGSFLLKEKSFNKFVKNIKFYFRSKLDYTKDLFWNLDDIMKKEYEKGFKSSFYFMSGGNSQFDNNYSLQDYRIKELIEHIENKGFEVGYHGSFNSFDDINIMDEEKTRIDEIVTCNSYGCRQHYLRFSTPTTWRIQEKVGLLYDTTLGYADYEGFRTGYCFPYKPFDLIEDRVMDIWEIPLIVMDATVSNYRKLSRSEGIERIKNLIDLVEKYKGVFTLLWHNSSFDELNNVWNKWDGAYEEILDYLVYKNAYVSSGRNIINKLI